MDFKKYGCHNYWIWFRSSSFRYQPIKFGTILIKKCFSLQTSLCRKVKLRHIEKYCHELNVYHTQLSRLPCEFQRKKNNFFPDIISSELLACHTHWTLHFKWRSVSFSDYTSCKIKIRFTRWEMFEFMDDHWLNTFKTERINKK